MNGMKTLLSVGYIAVGLYIGSNILPNEVGEKAIANNSPVFVPTDISPMKLNINLKTEEVKLEGHGDAEVQITREDKPVEIRTEYITVVKEKAYEVPLIVENISKADKLLKRIAPLSTQPLQVESSKIPEKINLARNLNYYIRVIKALSNTVERRNPLALIHSHVSFGMYRACFKPSLELTESENMLAAITVRYSKGRIITTGAGVKACNLKMLKVGRVLPTVRYY